MKPAQHDYLPDVIAQRRHAAALEHSLNCLLVICACATVLGLLCALVPLPHAYVFAALLPVCAVLFVLELRDYLRHRRALLP